MTTLQQFSEEENLFESDIDTMAHAAGWLVLCPEEAYERCLSHGSSLYILREDDLWVVWRGSWINGSSSPSGQKTLAKTTSFQHALHRAQRYIRWRLHKDTNTKEDNGSDLNRQSTTG